MEQQRYDEASSDGLGFLPEWNSSPLLEIRCLRDRQPLDYEQIIAENVRLLCIGENHRSLISKQEIRDLMPFFKRLGITHLAFEFLDAKDQEKVDLWYTGQLGDEEMKYLITSFSVPARQQALFEILVAAKRADIRILAVDTQQEDRNPQWAKIIDGALDSNLSAKVLLYCGAGHLAHEADDEVKYHYANTISAARKNALIIRLIGEDIEEGSSLDRDVLNVARQIRINGERFMAKLNPAFRTRASDYIVHLPYS